MSSQPQTEWEAVVVGGGAAGLSAALVLGRARRRTLVFDAGGQSNLPDHGVGGLLGLDGTPPAELYERAREQIAAYDSVEIRDVGVGDVRRDGDGFVVVAGDVEVRAQTLILAAGMDYQVPDIPGFREHWGREVFHCPFCHGWEARDSKLAICAEGEAAKHLEPLIAGWTDDATVVAPGDVAELRDDGEAVRALVLKDGSEVECEAVLVAAPLRQRSALPQALGLELNDQGLVAVDSMGQTSVPGVYAAGDMAVAPQQVVIAMASGHMAGVAVVRELLMGRTSPSVGARAAIRQVDLDDDSAYRPYRESSAAPFDPRDEGRSLELVSGALSGSADLHVGVMRLDSGEHHIPHHHPDGDEAYVFLSGRAELEIDREVQTAERGTVAFMPAGTTHGLRNRGDEPVDVLYAISAAEYEDVGLVYESG